MYLQVTVSTPSRAEPFTKELDMGFSSLGRALAGGHLPTIAKAVLSHEGLKELIMLKMIDAIDLEASKLCQYNSDSPSLFRKIKVERLPEFSWDSCISELQSKAPILLRILSTLASRNDHRNQHKKGAAHYPGICMAIATILKERNREMCGIQRLVSLILFTSRVQKQVI